MDTQSNQVFGAIIEMLLSLVFLSSMVSLVTEVILIKLINFKAIYLKLSLTKLLGKGMYAVFSANPRVEQMSRKGWLFKPITLEKELFSEMLYEQMSNGGTWDISSIQKFIGDNATGRVNKILTTFLTQHPTEPGFKLKLREWFDSYFKRSLNLFEGITKVFSFAVALFVIGTMQFNAFEFTKNAFFGFPDLEKNSLYEDYFYLCDREVIIEFQESLLLAKEVDKNSQDTIESTVKGFKEKYSSSILTILEPHQDKASETLKNLVESREIDLQSMRIRLKSMKTASFPQSLLMELEKLKKVPEITRQSFQLNWKSLSDKEKRKGDFLNLFESGFPLFVFNFILLAILLSFGAETWFKLLANFKKIRS